MGRTRPLARAAVLFGLLVLAALVVAFDARRNGSSSGIPMAMVAAAAVGLVISVVIDVRQRRRAASPSDGPGDGLEPDGDLGVHP